MEEAEKGLMIGEWNVGRKGRRARGFRGYSIGWRLWRIYSGGAALSVDVRS